MKLTKEEKEYIFKQESQKIHHNKYNYDEVDFINNETKVKILCPQHGYFYQTPYCHKKGQGCPICARESIKNKLSFTNEEFVAQLKKIHGNKYDYSKVNYINNRTKVCLVCPIHGDFFSYPSDLLNGHGCQKCANNVYTTESFINKAKQIHQEKYDYHLTEYKSMRDYITIICPKHGVFNQKASYHLQGNGCPKCGKENSSNKKMLSEEDIIQRGNYIHHDKYQYKDLHYQGSKSKIKIICPIHGEFQQEAESHLRGCGCPKCSHFISRYEDEIFGWITSFYKGDIIKQDRTILDGLELDLVLPNEKIALEFNGLYWHSDAIKNDKNYHLKKLEQCNEKGYRLIQIFEDEYIEHKEIVLTKIKYLMHQATNLEKIFARKCNVVEIEKKLAQEFLDKNHIQGYGKSTVALGTYYQNKLIGVMCFIKRENEWELDRFATDNNYICIGIGSKMFQYFIKIYKPNKVKSFADRRWTLSQDENLYVKLGFKLEKVLKPDYRYVIGTKRVHKFNYRKQILNKKYNLPLSLTEDEMIKQLNIHKIYDCGLFKYVWQIQ